MQHLNYFTILAVGRLLQSRVGGWRLMSAFSQTRDELVLAFAQLKGTRYFLRISCRGDVQYVCPTDSFGRSGSNVIELFEPVNGVLLESVKIAALDRLLVLAFENDTQLILKLHGNRANVLLCEGGEITQLFKSEHEDDWAHHNPQLYPVDASWADLLHPVKAQIEAVGAAADNAVQQILKAHPALKPLKPLLSDALDNYKDPWEGLQKAADALLQPPYGIGEKQLKPVFHLHAKADEDHRDELDTALSVFVGRWWRLHKLGDLQKRIEQGFADRRKHWEGRLHSGETGMTALDHQRPPEELGHLLMANLHRMETGFERIEVEDYYNDGRPLTIKLKPDLTPQANAERFYDKQKAVKHKRQHLQHMQEEATVKLAALDELEAEYRSLTRLKDIERFLKKHPKLLGQKQQKEKDAPAEPYWQFSLRGYDILVGKNAKKNDRLTFGVARKNDLWLHAKDVAGSHVVLRLQRDETPPVDVLEYAAGLAAWHSKLKNASMVPVIYTRRKYVRKPGKGAPPGLVSVQKEDVIMIEPERPKHVLHARSRKTKDRSRCLFVG